MNELQRCDIEIADAMREETLDGLLWEMDWRAERALIASTMAADGASTQHRD